MMFILVLMFMIMTLLFMTFTMFTQPLSMGLILVVQTLIMASLLYKTMKISWFTFMLMMMIAGALLVTFIYIAVLMPEEPHARRSFWSVPLIIPILYYMTYSSPSYKIPYLTPALPQTMYFSSSLPFVILLTVLLLISLILVVYNTRATKAPMRSYM